MRIFIYLFITLVFSACSTKQIVVVNDDDYLRRGFKVMQTDRGDALIFSERLLFEAGKSILLPQSREIIQKIASIILEKNIKSVQIGSYTEKGETDFNCKLSKARAEVLYQALVARKIKKESISIDEGYCNNETEIGTKTQKRKNHRSEIILLSASDKINLKNLESDILKLILRPINKTTGTVEDTVKSHPSFIALSTEEKMKINREAEELKSYQKNFLKLFTIRDASGLLSMDTKRLFIYRANHLPGDGGRLKLSISQHHQPGFKLRYGSYIGKLSYTISYERVSECIAIVCKGAKPKINVQAPLSETINFSLKPSSYNPIVIIQLPKLTNSDKEYVFNIRNFELRIDRLNIVQATALVH